MDFYVASVDLKIDSKFQHTIANEFKERMILCIAHRPQTIIAYIRIRVTDAGTIAEINIPVDLFTMLDSIFRAMRAAERWA
ncbi:hypothetical protein EDB19DRAFT_1740103 [Suillus lakei]|nr:hypothetical protein EDB19DRAFT_1740103 [Suillus lakei]